MALLLRSICLLTAAAAAWAAGGSIEGQVVNARTGTPLKRAMVRLVGGIDQTAGNPGAFLGGRGGARPLMMNRETDEQGRYVFSNLAPGKYRITVERQGFLRQTWGARKYSGGSTPVAVGEGQAVKSIDFRLAPQGVIVGMVLDEDGEPMANVQVRAERGYLRNGRRQWTTVVNGVTSDIGQYRLPELKPGRYVVVAMPRLLYMNMMAAGPLEPLPETIEAIYTSTFYPSTVDVATAVPVEVGEGGEVRDVDIRLVKTRVFRVRGHVTGYPAAVGGGRGGGVRVTLTPREGSASDGAILIGQASTSDGAFEIRGVPAGQYVAQAQAQSGGQPYAAVADVDVLGSHVDGLSLQLTPGGDVAGTIKVVDADSPPDLESVRVMLRPARFGGMGAQGRPGDDLKFTLRNVAPVRYAVSVTGVPDGFYVKSTQYGGTDIPEGGVSMTSGGALEITLSGAAARVDVVVTTAGQKVAPAAQIVVMKDGTPDAVRATDENGMLSLRGLAPGSYRLIAWEDIDPDQLWDPDFLSMFANEGKSVKLDASAHEAVQLTAIVAQ
ncbi:MAG: carboxypeptidase regulatory-like domain-containing protein [Acidobacteria bacterium]|nr:carboxypeptidase regulatory-like domain-containing protein [Acidobacteriota bacterium]